jgi:mono/diheme cytochrome c family protein
MHAIAGNFGHVRMWTCALLLALSMHVGAEEGEYVFKLGGCLACHTQTQDDAKPLAGGRGLSTPFGVFMSPNITPHPQHGIGRWTLEDFQRALREGVSPTGADYYPVFPYTSYTRMSDADIASLFVYLRAQPAVAMPNRAHEIPWYMQWRFVNWLWKLVFFDAGVFQPHPAHSESINRGAYIASALAHCGECHSPRGQGGAVDAGRAMSGVVDGPEGESAPNITPDKASGIGGWDKLDLAAYLESGALPDGDYAGGLMAEVIDNGLSAMTTSDREALVEYMLSLPPIHNPAFAR